MSSTSELQIAIARLYENVKKRREDYELPELFESLIGKLTNYPELNEMIQSLLFTATKKVSKSNISV